MPDGITLMRPTNTCRPFFALLNELFAQSNIFFQRIQHAFQRALFKRAQLADRLTLLYAVFTQQQRLREETSILAVAFNVSTFNHTFSPLNARTRDRPKRAAA